MAINLAGRPHAERATSALEAFEKGRIRLEEAKEAAQKKINEIAVKRKRYKKEAAKERVAAAEAKKARLVSEKKVAEVEEALTASEEARRADRAKLETAERLAADRGDRILTLEGIVGQREARIAELEARNIEQIKAEGVKEYEETQLAGVLKKALNDGAKEGRKEGFADGFELALAKLSRMHPELNDELDGFSCATEFEAMIAEEAAAVAEVEDAVGYGLAAERATDGDVAPTGETGTSTGVAAMYR